MTPEVVFVVCRFVHFLTLMLLFGYAGFITALTPAALRPRLIIEGRSATLSTAALMLASAIAMIPLQSAQMGDGWTDALNLSNWQALRDTAFGQVWQWHVGIALLAFLCAVMPLHSSIHGSTHSSTHSSTHGPAPRRTLTAYTILTLSSAALLASLGLLGHAAMRQDLLGDVQRINHALHLLSAGAWLGGLPPLLLCLRTLRDDQRRPQQREQAGQHAHRQHRDAAIVALRRFSTMGHVAVAIVVLTGVVNTVLIVGGWPTNLASPYQRLLDVKIAIVAVMVGIALINRYHFVPSMRRVPEASVRALAIGTWAEILLGAGVLALVSAFATLDPQP